MNNFDNLSIQVSIIATSSTDSDYIVLHCSEFLILVTLLDTRS